MFIDSLLITCFTKVSKFFFKHTSYPIHLFTLYWLRSKNNLLWNNRRLCGGAKPLNPLVEQPSVVKPYGIGKGIGIG